MSRRYRRLEPKTQLPVTFRVPANDEPHGVFSLSPHQQPLVVLGSGSEVSRALSVNVTRLAGLFGNASVGYRVRGEVGEILGERAEGRIFFMEGRTVATLSVPLGNQVPTRTVRKLPQGLTTLLPLQVFLSVGETFTIELADVRLLGPLMGSAPRLLEANVVTATVPEEAANAEVSSARVPSTIAISISDL